MSPCSDNSKSSASLQTSTTQQQVPPKTDTINNVFTWVTPKGENPASEVKIAGQFGKKEEYFQNHILMTKNGNEFTAIIEVDKGIIQYKFIVDNVWRCMED